jgi:hypothetical protein
MHGDTNMKHRNDINKIWMLPIYEFVLRLFNIDWQNKDVHHFKCFKIRFQINILNVIPSLKVLATTYCDTGKESKCVTCEVGIFLLVIDIKM